MNFEERYRFTIKARLESLVGDHASAQRSREMPGGTRMYITYKNGLVVMEPDKAAVSPVRGKILTSGDWALLRSDGVLLLDSRFTIETDVSGSTELNPGLISATLKGRADLSHVYEKTDGPGAYKAWVAKDPPKTTRLPLVGTLTFEASGSKPEDQTFAAARYEKAAKAGAPYASLTRGVFLGKGDILLNKKQHRPEVGYAQEVQLHVYEVVADLRAPAADARTATTRPESTSASTPTGPSVTGDGASGQ